MTLSLHRPGPQLSSLLSTVCLSTNPQLPCCNCWGLFGFKQHLSLMTAVLTWTGEKTQHLKTLLLSENPNSVPSTLISGGSQLLGTPAQWIQHEMVQQFRECAALVEVLESVPSTTRQIRSICNSSSTIWCCFLSTSARKHTAHLHIPVKHSSTLRPTRRLS